MISHKLNIPDEVRELAEKIYVDALKAKLHYGFSKKASAIAALYVACKMKSFPLRLREVAFVFDLEYHEVTKCYHKLLRVLDLTIPQFNSVLALNKIADRLNLPSEVRELALRIFNASKALLSGKDPFGVAGACIYLASQIKDKAITQRTIAEASGVTEITIRIRYITLLTYLVQKHLNEPLQKHLNDPPKWRHKYIERLKKVFQA